MERGEERMYSVTFSTFRDGGQRATYRVATHFGPLKAVSIATEVHRSRATWPIFEIEVEQHPVGTWTDRNSWSELFDDRDEY